MEALTLKELKKIEKWFADHEDDMNAGDSKIYEKINMIIEEMEEEDESCVKTRFYDEDSPDESDDEKDYYYDEYAEDDN